MNKSSVQLNSFTMEKIKSDKHIIKHGNFQAEVCRLCFCRAYDISTHRLKVCEKLIKVDPVGEPDSTTSEHDYDDNTYHPFSADEGVDIFERAQCVFGKCYLFMC